MKLIRIYECFCDETRLRILHLLTHGSLCVCHFQEILGIPQAKVSQHLAYLRKRGMVETTRQGNWMIYSLPGRLTPELESNLKCLQDCVQSDRTFQADLRRRGKVQADWVEEARKRACTC
ncbi:MAG: metalloregulator ArsR/SmtB family transcription factor [Terrimicrobiaceae bacterium]|nr:metalloregulator ArsR/SmtB family transcription factor [Terrimicrobiaceae bacterium]